MPSKKLARPRNVEPRPSRERATDIDGWRQIDRWVNEGGAEERKLRPVKFGSERLKS
jgi:hypothetical protein